MSFLLTLFSKQTVKSLNFKTFILWEEIGESGTFSSAITKSGNVTYTA